VAEPASAREWAVALFRRSVLKQRKLAETLEHAEWPRSFGAHSVTTSLGPVRISAGKRRSAARGVGSIRRAT